MVDPIDDGEAPVPPRREIRGWRNPQRRGLQVAAGAVLAAWLLALAFVAYARWALGGLARHIAGH